MRTVPGDHAFAAQDHLEGALDVANAVRDARQVRVEFPMGIGAGLAAPLMAMGDWQTAYMIGGSVLATAFVMCYYFYFARIDSRPEPVLEPAPAR